MKPCANKFVKYQSGNVILKSTQAMGPLILGDCNSAMDKKIQKQHKIHTVISIGQQAMPVKQKLPENCKHFFYDIHDNKSQKVSAQLFDQISKLIEEGRQIGGVLVHCYAGVSRSSTFVIAYIMQKFLKSYEESRQEVKGARNCIYPNDGFVHQLKQYQKVLEFRQQERLRKVQEQKNRLINQSLVQSARKSIRGGVRGASISPQKVKDLNLEIQKKSYELFIEPIFVPLQLKIQKQEQKSDEIAKIKNSLHHILSVKQKNRLKEKIKPSKQVFLEKSFSISQKLKESIKLPKVKQTSHTERAKKDEQKNERERVRQNRIDEKEKTIRQMDKKSQQISQFGKQQKQRRVEKDMFSKISTQGKQKSHSTMRESKSVINGRQYISEIDDKLLNNHERKIKRIYQSKMNVK